MAVSGSAKICFSALMTSAIFMLQMSCFFFPVLGSLLSTASTMFVAMAAVILKRRTGIVYLGAGLLIFAISPRYAVEFLMTTGFVGLALGLFMEKNHVFALFISSIGMFSGLCCLTYLLGTVSLGRMLVDLPIVASLPVYAIFAVGYSVFWYYVLRKLTKTPIFTYHC